MIVKLALAGVLALACSPAHATQIFVSDPYIKKIDCDKGSGTGFRLDNGQWVSANHVTTLGGCKIDGVAINVTYADPLKDYSLFSIPGDSIRAGGLRLDCNGFHNKRWYYGIGAALGNPILTATPVMGTDLFDDMPHPRKWTPLLYNRFIPGESGGAVKDALTGAVVGIVNAYSPIYPLSFSIPLSETVLCDRVQILPEGDVR